LAILFKKAASANRKKCLDLKVSGVRRFPKKLVLSNQTSLTPICSLTDRNMVLLLSSQRRNQFRFLLPSHDTVSSSRENNISDDSFFIFLFGRYMFGSL